MRNPRVHVGPGASPSVAAWIVLGLVLAVASCSPEKHSPMAPTSELPPSVTEVSPPARSVNIWYDTPIWADFAEPLDPATVSERNVFLKIDTRRLQISVHYDVAARRITITPLELIPLLRTLTVELTPRIATANGTPLGQTYFWQYNTNGLRRLTDPSPADGAAGESPVSMLAWPASDPSAGDIEYVLSYGSDSLAVATRTSSRTSLRRAYFFPVPRWPLDATRYWAVSVTNHTTGETLDSPVWRFQTLPASTPIDTVVVFADWNGYFWSRVGQTRCNIGVTSGPEFLSAVHFPLGGVPNARLAGAVMRFASTTRSSMNLRAPQVWPMTADMPSCQIVDKGPPFADAGLGSLAFGIDGTPDAAILFTSDALSAHLEAMLRHPGFYGYMLRSNVNTTYTGFDLRLFYYRVPTAALQARTENLPRR
jgi:hypothetical protein